VALWTESMQRPVCLSTAFGTAAV